MEKLLLSVLNMSLTASYVIIVICIIRILFQKAPKVISYALWGVVGFRLIFPFSFESVFSLLPFHSSPIPKDIAYQPMPRIESGIGLVDNTVSSLLKAPVEWESVNPLQITLWLGSYIWLIGIVIMLIYSFASTIILKKGLKSAWMIKENIYEANELKTPFVFGLFHPKIYIPTGLSEAEKNYIILHEKTHIHRYDHVIKFLAYLILCLHWFNPLVWLAFLLMGADMEMSCDEHVLKGIGGKEKKAYSLSLLNLATKKRIIGGSPLAFGEGGMKTRIKNVLNFKKPSRMIVIFATVVAAIFSVGFAINRVTNKESLIEMEERDNNASLLMLSDIEKISVGTMVNDVHQMLGEPHGQLSGFLGDIYNVAGDIQAIIYYDSDGMVAEVKLQISDNLANWAGNFNGKEMTIDDIRELAKKGNNLIFEDLAEYRGINVSSNFEYCIMVYRVDGGYRLVVHSKLNQKPDRVNLENVWETSGSGIDIRYGNLDEFLNKWPIIMQVKEDVTPSGATIILKNVTDNEYSYGDVFKLQHKNNGDWTDVATIIPDYGFDAIGYNLKAEQTMEIKIDWSLLYGELLQGDYRIVKEAYLVNALNNDKKHILFASFTIEDSYE